MDQSPTRIPLNLDVAPARPASAVRPVRRHALVVALFCVMVLIPSALAWTYLAAKAVDRYASRVAFSVRAEEAPSAVELLGGIADLSTGRSPDSDILQAFILSQDMVRRIDARLDLRRLFRPEGVDDPVFTLAEGAPIEGLSRYWAQRVQIDHDTRTGLIELQVEAFAPGDAQRLAAAIFEESAAMINALSDEAHAAATRYAREDLSRAVGRLRDAREAVTRFRSRYSIVDPNADLRGRMGLLNSLESQLSETVIELDLLRETTRESDSRVQSMGRRVAVIEARIAEERRKLGVGGSENTGGPAYADLVGEYERLQVDREFAERSYLAALAAHDAAQAEARRQTRFLAAHIRPTLPESAEFPQRLQTGGLIAGFLCLIWSVLALILASLRDRR